QPLCFQRRCLELMDHVPSSYGCTIPSTTSRGTTTAIIASPAIKPDDSGTRYRPYVRAFHFDQTISTTPPRNMTKMTAAGTSIPIPTPVGEGTNRCHLPDSRTASRIPISEPTIKAVTAPGGSALSPRDRISANPAHLRDIGELKPA